MDIQEQLKREIVENLRQILKTSLPHCKDGNPNEAAFVEINQLAHDSFLKLERLRVQELV